MTLVHAMAANGIVKKCISAWAALVVLAPKANQEAIQDKQVGKLSLDSIDMLCTLETNDKKYVRDTILYGSATIKRVAKIVESFANTFIPYHINSLEP
jgi:hypothetical protein